MNGMAITGLIVLCVGLLADITGFILVFFRGHLVFIRRVSSEEDFEADVKNNRILRWWAEGETTREDLRQEAKARRLAYYGAVLVISGFVLQIVGAIVVFGANI